MNPVYVEVALETNTHEYEIGVEETFRTVSLPWYEGPYEVIPRAMRQILETNQKSMNDDVNVTEIPYSSVENQSGGNTINIAFL